MRIAVDTRFLQAAAAYGYHIEEIFCRIAENHPEHQFIFLFDELIDFLPDLPVNVTTVIITPAPKNIIQYKWWYDVKLPLALKKHKADVFVGTYGLCSLNTTVPQLLIVQNLAFLRHPVLFHKQCSFFYKTFTLRFLKKASSVAAVSDFIKKEIVTAYSVPAEKIITTGSAAGNAFRPLNLQEREKVKERFTHGCEYFIFTGGLDPLKNAMNVLKAFSLFKKRQKTNMKLVIAGNIAKYKDQAEKLNSYKYRDDIRLAVDLSIRDLALVTGGAYAMVFIPLHQGFGMAVLEAMQCEVPVITSAGSNIAQTAGDAALYADPGEPEGIAEQMKRIFKDEVLRNKLIAAGKEHVKTHNLEKTITLTWQAVEKAVSG